MPEICRDRPSRCYEHIFLLTKSKKYYYDAAAIAAVSYTHLDVYKRQIEDFFPRNGVRYIAMNDGIDTLRDNNDICLLYTSQVRRAGGC